MAQEQFVFKPFRTPNFKPLAFKTKTFALDRLQSSTTFEAPALDEPQDFQTNLDLKTNKQLQPRTNVRRANRTPISAL
ncbi:MAG: hypothetical protein ABI700_00990 [Chloroflexota bacterium]